jgi:hypothetical protein
MSVQPKQPFYILVNHFWGVDLKPELTSKALHILFAPQLGIFGDGLPECLLEPPMGVLHGLLEVGRVGWHLGSLGGRDSSNLM